MTWFSKIAWADKERILNNIDRLNELKAVVHDLGFFVVASNGGGYQVLQELLQEQLVRGRAKVYNKLKSALIGENNQKVALDAPMTFQRICGEAEDLIDAEINKERKLLKELQKTDVQDPAKPE